MEVLQNFMGVLYGFNRFANHVQDIKNFVLSFCLFLTYLKLGGRCANIKLSSPKTQIPLFLI